MPLLYNKNMYLVQEIIYFLNIPSQILKIAKALLGNSPSIELNSA